MKKKIHFVLLCLFSSYCFSMDSPLVPQEKRSKPLAFSPPVNRIPQIFPTPMDSDDDDDDNLPQQVCRTAPESLLKKVTDACIAHLSLPETSQISLISKNSTQKRKIYHLELRCPDGRTIPLFVKRNSGILIDSMKRLLVGVLEGGALRRVAHFFQNNPNNSDSIVPVVPFFFDIMIEGQEHCRSGALSDFPLQDDISPVLQPLSKHRIQMRTLPPATWFFSDIARGIPMTHFIDNPDHSLKLNLYREFGKRIATFHTQYRHEGNPLFTKIIHSDLNPENILIDQKGDFEHRDFSQCTFSVIDWEFANYDYYRDGDIFGFLMHVFLALPLDNVTPENYRQNVLWSTQCELAVTFIQEYCMAAYGSHVYKVLTTNGLSNFIKQIHCARYGLDTKYSFLKIYEKPLQEVFKDYTTKSLERIEPDHLNRRHKITEED